MRETCHELDCMQGQRAQAVQYLARALEEARAGFGPGDPHVAAACHNLAEAHRLLRDFQAAEPLYQEVSSADAPVAWHVHALGSGLEMAAVHQ